MFSTIEMKAWETPARRPELGLRPAESSPNVPDGESNSPESLRSRFHHCESITDDPQSALITQPLDIRLAYEIRDHRA